MSLVNPGFVRTPLTDAERLPDAGADRRAEEAAEEMVRGWEAGRFEIHFPKRFTLWMKALRHLHDALYFAGVHPPQHGAM